MKNIKKTKEIIVEALEGKRTKQVWNLIEKAVKKIYKGKIKIPKTTKEEYLSYEDIINDEQYRYLIVEEYNLEDSFNFRYYEGKGWTIKKMFEDYFSDCGGNWNKILFVDMEEKKCYLLDKKVSYDKKKVEI